MKKPPTRKASKKIQDEVFPGFTERSERGKKNRKTGTDFERKIAVKLREVWPGARREFGQAREGNEVPDLGGTPYWIECSKGATRNIHEKLSQAIVAAQTTPSTVYKDLSPVVISYHANRGLTMVTMTLDDWLQIQRVLCQL